MTANNPSANNSRKPIKTDRGWAFHVSTTAELSDKKGARITSTTSNTIDLSAENVELLRGDGEESRQFIEQSAHKFARDVAYAITQDTVNKSWLAARTIGHYVGCDFVSQILASIREHIPPPEKDVNP